MSEATDSSQRGYWLLVDDDANDEWTFCRACSRAFDSPPLIYREHDGRSAVSFLEACSRRPDLIVSDIKMPGVDGFEFLAWVRSQPSLTGVTFIFLTNSAASSDMARAKELRAHRYLVKPSDMPGYIQLVKTLSSDADPKELSISSQDSKPVS